MTARDKSPEAEESFSRLYKDYWPPLYSYLRRRGRSHAESEEITQDFFVTLVTKNRLSRLGREGGRFRSFLLTSMQNFLANIHDRDTAAKRGGGVPVLSFDEISAEPDRTFVTDGKPPEVEFDREWALLVLKRALAAIEQEFSAGNKQKLFAALRPQLQGDRGGRPYPEIAAELTMTESAVKVAVHRMRQRYGEILREEIQRTVGSPADVQEELRHLLCIVGS